jgi:DNA-binding transcriptional regulator GbsR (MarR family)
LGPALRHRKLKKHMLWTPVDTGRPVSYISVMTEMTEAQDLPLPITRFILHWGDLGGQWGVNRSVAQIHALLYVSERPQTAEEIAETLRLARSNVSTSIRELLGWKLVHRVPVMGDRRDHFAAETDVWEVVTRIAAGRKAREIDPAQAALEACVAEAGDDRSVSPVARARLGAMLEFVTTMSRWHDQMIGIPKPTLMKLIRMGKGVTKFVTWAGAKQS